MSAMLAEREGDEIERRVDDKCRTVGECCERGKDGVDGLVVVLLPEMALWWWEVERRLRAKFVEVARRRVRDNARLLPLGL
jgi:hypothetical protein